MALNITNLFYSEKDIGATLKISKKQYIWEFDLNGSSQRIELLDSRLSHKKRLFKNGVNILKTTEEGNFIHNFEIDGQPCVIIQYGDKIELRINNQSFTHLYNLQKNKQLFAGEKGPTSNIYVAKPYNSYGSSDNKNNNNESAFYKINKPEDENKPKLFDFEIKKDSGNKSHGLAKFKFGQNKDKPSFNSNNNHNIQNNNSNINNNKDKIDLLGIQNKDLNENNNVNNNNNLLDFGQNTNQNSQNNQKGGNDIFNLFGNNNNINNQNNNNNLNNNNLNNNNLNNNNLYNNIFLQISDGNNQQPNFDQNNLGFLNNMNNNNMISNNQNNNFQNQQNNNFQNQQNNTTNIDLLNF